MANVIKLRRSAVQGNIPTTAQIALGEVAINTFDGKLFIKKDDGTESVVEPGYNGAIVSDTPPAARPDGSTLAEGDQWWKSDASALYVYYGSSWISVGGGGIEEAPLDDNYYVRFSGTWVNLTDALTALGVPVAEPVDAGNFTTGLGAAVTNQTYDAGNFTDGTSAATDDTVIDGGLTT